VSNHYINRTRQSYAQTSLVVKLGSLLAYQEEHMKKPRDQA